MTKECKQQFTLRITQANKTELIVILYEMLLTYTQDAKISLQEGNTEAFRDNIRKADNCLTELTESLDLSYEIGRRLLSLYMFCKKELLKADVRKKKSLFFMWKPSLSGSGMPTGKWQRRTKVLLLWKIPRKYMPVLPTAATL